MKYGLIHHLKTRTGCSYLKQLCIDEFELFSAFFNTGETLL